MKSWHVYLIFNQNCTYIGATNNLKQRIRKHNGEIKGGAKYTTKKGKGWEYACYVSGFKNNIDALQFEWAWQHPNRCRQLKSSEFRTTYNSKSRTVKQKLKLCLVLASTAPWSQFGLRVHFFGYTGYHGFLL